MKGILKRTMNDLLGKNVKIADWQVVLFYSLIILVAVVVYLQ